MVMFLETYHEVFSFIFKQEGYIHLLGAGMAQCAQTVNQVLEATLGYFPA